MTPKIPKFEKASARLISLIQNELNEELGEPGARVSEMVMEKARELLAAAKENKVLVLLNGVSLTQFLGETWVRKHPGVKRCISGFEAMLKDEASR